MSGIDEQCLDKCPCCNELPPYWALGNKVDGGLVWIKTEKYHSPRERNSILFTAFNTPKNVDDIEHRIEYLWCSNCHNRIEDKSLINLMFGRAKKFEREGRIDIH